MSQFDFGTIDPDTKNGTDLATDLNNWRNALHSMHRGASRPSYVATSMLWVKEVSATVWQIVLYDGTDDVVISTINPTTQGLSLNGGALTNDSVPNAALVSDVLASLGGLPIVSGDLIYGSGANALSRLAKGADGQILSLVGGLPAWGQAGGFRSVQSFASSGTWTRPSGITKIWFFITGGGGGGGGADGLDDSGDRAAGGGGSAATVIKFLDVSAIPSVTVTIGGGGAGGGINGTAGTPGGISTFGSHASAGGGFGGEGTGTPDPSYVIANGGAGATLAIGGDINLNGGRGFPSHAVDYKTGSIEGITGGYGATSFWGPGGFSLLKTGPGAQNGANTSVYGAGGGGAVTFSTTSHGTGGSGGGGICYVLEFA